MSPFANHQVAARLARRELRRRPLTTVLLVVLVAVPVAALLVAATHVRTPTSYPPPPPRHPDLDLGHADAAVTVARNDRDGTLEGLRAQLPDARLVTIEWTNGQLTAPDGERALTDVVAGPFTDPLLGPLFPIIEGRLPGAPGEVTVSEEIATHWQVAVGDELHLPELRTRARVVGVFPTPGHHRGNATANSWLVVLSEPVGLVPDRVYTRTYVDAPGELTSAATDWLRKLPSGPMIRADLDSAPPRTFQSFPLGEYRRRDLAATYIGAGLALAVMAIVSSSAFAIGARRQLRTQGLLSSTGCPPEVQRSSLLWQGVWTGVAGAVTGTAFGAGALLVIQARGDAWSRPFGWQWSIIDILVLGALSIGAATGAAVVPAITAGRTSTLAALAGRRPLRRVRPAQVAIGVASAVAGLGFTFLSAYLAFKEADPTGARTAVIAIVGGVLVLAGLCLGAPAAVGAAGALGGRLSGSAHLALRSLARQRARAGAAVAGIGAAAALAVGAASTISGPPNHPGTDAPLAENVVVVRGGGYGMPGDAPPPNNQVLSDVAGTLPGWKPVDVQGFLAEGVGEGGREGAPALVALATPDLLDALPLSDADRRALDEQGAIVFEPDADLAFTIFSWDEGRSLHTPVRTATASGQPANPLVAGLITQARATDADLANLPRSHRHTAFVGDRPITDEQERKLTTIRADLSTRYDRFRFPGDPAPSDHDAWISSYETLRGADYAPLAHAAIGAGALVFAGLVVVLSLALAARDSRDERAVLEAVGGYPKLIRRLAGMRAGALALIGGVLAVPTGLLPVWSTHLAQPRNPVVVPWPTLATVVVVMPLVIGLLAMAGSAVASRRRPVTGLSFAES